MGMTLDTNSGPDTSFGVTSVGSSLTSTAGGGVAQTGAITVGTTSSLTRSEERRVGKERKDLVGAGTASGANITLADANDLSASITATGSGDLYVVAGAVYVV